MRKKIAPIAVIAFVASLVLLLLAASLGVIEADFAAPQTATVFDKIVGFVALSLSAGVYIAELKQTTPLRPAYSYAITVALFLLSITAFNGWFVGAY